MTSRVQLSSTFPIEEVHLILLLARTLQRGGDPSTLIRHPAWQNLVRKFQRMEEKHQHHLSPGPGPAPAPAPEPIEPPEKPAPDPNLEANLQKNLTSDPTRQHFLDQGYTMTETEAIVRTLKKGGNG